MKSHLIDRTWISPLVTVGFGVIGVTGLLLFFHMKNGVIMTLHEWFGWGFVIAGMLHLLLNWRPLTGYLRHRNALVALVLSSLLTVGLAIAGTAKQERGGGMRSAISVMLTLDANGNGIVESNEISNASAALKNLDQNGDGQLNPVELQPQGSVGGGHPH